MTTPHGLRIADGVGFAPVRPEELREWYETILRDLERSSNGDVLAAFLGCFFPALYRHPGRPSAELLEAAPGQFIEIDGAWYGLMPLAAEEAWYGLMPAGVIVEMFPTASGFAIRTPDGRIIQDREEALAWAPPHAPHAPIRDVFPPRLIEIITHQMTSGRRAGVSPRTGKPWRRGVDRGNLARSLVVMYLALSLGQRAAARLVILWDAELQGPLADGDAAHAVRRFQAGQLAASARELETPTQAVLRDTRRILDVIFPASR
ncbi:MAG: hypothetical protein H0X20_04460 [Chloroflexi bacterium]|nr:hypothetical protein [Chloroflexota bacterium]